MKILHHIPKGQAPGREAFIDSLRLHEPVEFYLKNGFGGTSYILGAEKIDESKFNQLWFTKFRIGIFDPGISTGTIYWGYISTHHRSGFTVDSKEKFNLVEHLELFEKNKITHNGAPNMVPCYLPLKADEVDVLLYLSQISPETVQRQIRSRFYAALEGNTYPKRYQYSVKTRYDWVKDMLKRFANCGPNDVMEEHNIKISMKEILEIS